MAGKHWPVCSNPTCLRSNAMLLEKIYQCIIYCSTKVGLCKLKNIVFPNWGDVNIGNAEGEAGSLWEPRSASLSDFSLLWRHFQVDCNCLLVYTSDPHKSSLAQTSKLCCVWKVFGNVVGGWEGYMIRGGVAFSRWKSPVWAHGSQEMAAKAEPSWGALGACKDTLMGRLGPAIL